MTKADFIARIIFVSVLGAPIAVMLVGGWSIGGAI